MKERKERAPCDPTSAMLCLVFLKTLWEASWKMKSPVKVRSIRPEIISIKLEASQSRWKTQLVLIDVN